MIDKTGRGDYVFRNYDGDWVETALIDGPWPMERRGSTFDTAEVRRDAAGELYLVYRSRTAGSAVMYQYKPGTLATFDAEILLKRLAEKAG